MPTNPHRPSTDKEKEYFQKLAWDYFSLHSSQRISTFNFFIAIATVLTTAMVATFAENFAAPEIGIPLSLLIIGFSYLFLCLDNRNRDLIKHSESVLISLEGEDSLAIEKTAEEHSMNHPGSADPPPRGKLFSYELYEATLKKQKFENRETKKSVLKSRGIETPKWIDKSQSYAKCFQWTLFAFAIIGLLGTIASSCYVINTRILAKPTPTASPSPSPTPKTQENRRSGTPPGKQSTPPTGKSG